MDTARLMAYSDYQVLVDTNQQVDRLKRAKWFAYENTLLKMFGSGKLHPKPLIDPRRKRPSSTWRRHRGAGSQPNCSPSVCSWLQGMKYTNRHYAVKRLRVIFCSQVNRFPALLTTKSHRHQARPRKAHSCQYQQSALWINPEQVRWIGFGVLGRQATETCRQFLGH